MCGWRACAPSSPLAGFAPTYWLQLPPGTFVGSPLLHLHGWLFTAWPLFLLLQTTLAARGLAGRHRAWGLLGVSLATAMVFVGFAVANRGPGGAAGGGFGDRARAFHIASMSMIALFGVFVFAAIAYVARPEIHKRLMLLATASMIPPAIARLFFAVNVGIGPWSPSGSRAAPYRWSPCSLPALIADALILAGMLYDVRTRGRPHPATSSAVRSCSPSSFCACP